MKKLITVGTLCLSLLTLAGCGATTSQPSAPAENTKTEATAAPSGEGKEDVPVYIVIDGIQGCSPKLRYIYSPTITYNEGQFMVGGSEKTLREVFGDEDDDFSRELLFRRLRIYEDDVPKAVK